MKTSRLVLLTSLSMIAFAGNSLLCRLALVHTHTDPASFTTIRVISAAVMLSLLVSISSARKTRKTRSWMPALSLFVYAAGFSFAYTHLSTASGALLLFGGVQLTMIGYGLYKGERLATIQLIGFLIAVSGVTVLLMPGIESPPIASAVLMLIAGAAWGIYSLKGQGIIYATASTKDNFKRTIPLAIVLNVLMLKNTNVDAAGLMYAVASGAIASGLGYALWYRVLPALKATHASTVQLSVPVIAAIGGYLFLDETLDLRIILASVATLGGIALVLLVKTPSKIEKITP